MNTYGLNQEGYPDPTATQAVAAATKAERSIFRWFISA